MARFWSQRAPQAAQHTDAPDVAASQSKQGNMQQRAPSRPLALRGLLRGERVAQRAGAVEHQAARRGVGVHAEEAQALQLEAGRRRIGLGLGVTAHTRQSGMSGPKNATHQGCACWPSGRWRAQSMRSERSARRAWLVSLAGACAMRHGPAAHVPSSLTCTFPTPPRQGFPPSGEVATQSHCLRGW
jgi:hypothetical protein